MIYLIFFLFTFLPVLPIMGVGIPTILFLTPLALFKKKIKFDKKFFKYTAIISILLLFTYIPLLFIYNNLTLKDILFLFYPFIIFLIYHIFTNLLDINDEHTKKKINKLLKIYLLFQLLICILQTINLFQFNNIFKSLFIFWQKTNALKDVSYLEISYRPFGTVGSPIFLAIISYLFGKIISKNENNYFYTIISLIIIAIAGARSALIISIILECYEKIIKNFLKNPFKSIIYAAVFIIFILFAINYIPFINKIYLSYFVNKDSITSDYSFSYRLKMLEMLFANKRYLLLGGYGINNFPSYVDCEYIIRLMQFGIFNYIIIIFPYYYIYNKSFLNKEKIDILIFVLFNMLTAVILTNLFLMQFVIFTLFILSKEDKKNENCLFSC